MRLVAVLILCGGVLAQTPPQRPGPLPDGGFLLPTGWTIKPAGRQVPLSTLPMSAVLSPDKKYLLVLNAGYRQPSISVLDAKTLAEVGSTPVPDAWLGMAFSPDGRLLYIGGGSSGSVFEFSFTPEGKLEPKRKLPTVVKEETGPPDFIGDVALSPDGRLIYAASLFRDQILVINPQSGWVIERFKTARRPYRILFHPNGESFFVTSWGEGSVHHHRTSDGEHLAMERLGAQPMDMVWRDKPVRLEAGEQPPAWKARIFVAVANTNQVFVLGVDESNRFEVIETIRLSLWPYQPLGMTPSALALSEDQDRLFVVCSDYNTVALVDVSGAKSKVAGFLPTGWYPTAVRPLPEGRLAVLNGRGGKSYPNPNGPNPLADPQPVDRGIESQGYVARLQTGTASLIDPIDSAALRDYTRTVFRNSPYSDQKLTSGPDADQQQFPIQHVLYIVKESRSYDEIFGDPKTAVFGEQITPNHHKLANEFVAFDNFYVNGDVDADGQNWSTAAIASAYVQRLWPSTYAGRRSGDDYHEVATETVPAAGYLWTNAIAAGLAVRNYGLLAINHDLPAADGIQVKDVRDPALRDFTSRLFRGFDLDYPDVSRAEAFIKDFHDLEASGKIPRLMVMRLGNDHTWGATRGKLSPQSMMADNDSALGMVVEACSKSRFWPRMAIFVLEDDAQGGRGHVDSHHSPAFIISPYTRAAGPDSTMYNTASMLRTIELILGLKPMTHYDAAATPMLAPFRDKPDLTPYAAEKPRVPLSRRNPSAAGLPVVSGEWLAQHLDDSSLVVLHVGTPADYGAGHIPGARLLQLTDISVTSEDGLRVQLAPAEQLRQAFANAGVSDSTRVVLCSGTDSVQTTTRVFFTLDYLGLGERVSLLDGGLALWRNEDRPVSAAAPTVTPGALTVKPRAELVVESAWLHEHLTDPEVVVLDARTPEFYFGANAGAMPRAGRIPGARNIPFTSALDEQRKFRSPDELREMLLKAGAGSGKTLVSYCHIGMQATVLYFLARSFGYDVRLYDGSFQDWSRRSELPVETSSR